ncbi:MAG: TPR end-of-group domain-containing protein [Planctomycetota bacterium]
MLSHLLLLSCAFSTPPVVQAAPSQQPAQQPAQQPSAQSELQRAGQAMRQGNMDQAIGILKPLTETQPNQANAWYLLGYCYHAKKDFANAIPAHTRAATFPATAANASYNLACAHALQGNTEDAFTWLGKAKAAGFSNWGSLWSDPDLTSIQSDPRFLNFAPPQANFESPFVEETEILFAWHGEGTNDQFGWVAADAGDIDADGVHDVITSAPYLKASSAAPAAAGRVYLYSGRTGEEIRQHSGAAGDLLGLSVSGVGDLNGDGHADYAATATRTNNTKQAGSVMVWSGKDGLVLLDIQGAAPGDGFGREVGSIFDVDGDGIPDVLIGSYQWGQGRGKVTIHSGADGSLLQEIAGESATDGFGSTVSAGGEGNHRFLVVGAMTAGASGTGQVQVYRYHEETKSFRGVFRMSAEKGNVAYGQYFSSVIGDTNADGIDDIYTVDFSASSGGNGSGQVRIHSGADGKQLWRRDGLAGEGLGIGNAIAGDINGDGHDDVLTGAWTNSAAAASGGRCYLLSGKDGKVLRMWTCNIAGATMGFDSTSLPDCNEDGARDLLFTAAWTGVKGPKTGSVYLVSGKAD